MDLARRRIEQLQVRGLLGKWQSRQDLKTIEFLQSHPDRRFPEDAAAWFREPLRILWIGDPGNYRILRVLILEGGMPEPGRTRAIRSSAIFIGAIITVLLYLGLIGIALGVNGLRPGNVPPIRFDRLANLALFCTLGGVLIEIFLYHQFRNDFQKLEDAVRSLD